MAVLFDAGVVCICPDIAEELDGAEAFVDAALTGFVLFALFSMGLLLELCCCCCCCC